MQTVSPIQQPQTVTERAPPERSQPAAPPAAVAKVTPAAIDPAVQGQTVPQHLRFGLRYDAEIAHLFIEMRDPDTGTVVQQLPPEQAARSFRRAGERSEDAAPAAEQEAPAEPVRIDARA